MYTQVTTFVRNSISYTHHTCRLCGEEGKDSRVCPAKLNKEPGVENDRKGQ